MSNKALRKKTMGIKNEVWINKCSHIIFTTYLANGLACLIEVISHIVKGETKVENEHASRATALSLFLLLYMALKFIIFAVLREIEDRETFRKDAKIIVSITLFFAVCQFNPFMIWYKQGSGLVHDALKYTFLTQSITLPIFFAVSLFAAFILWRMSKVKPDYDGDEPYEVIYGGEGSSTKKYDESTD